MIVFDLCCANDHTFEGWFDDGKAYEEQKANNLVACPVCNDTSVSRVPSGFAIKSASQSHKSRPDAGREGMNSHKDVAQLGEMIADYVDKNFDDVGCEFATEALKIHYGVSEPRNIKGVSTKEEEKTLKDEGIEFFKVPAPSPPSDSDA